MPARSRPCSRRGSTACTRASGTVPSRRTSIAFSRSRRRRPRTITFMTGRTSARSCWTRMPEPKQARSRETQGRIVAAALEFVAERGREGPSVPEIAERAGVSIGAFPWSLSDEGSALRARRPATLRGKRALLGRLPRARELARPPRRRDRPRGRSRLGRRSRQPPSPQPRADRALASRPPTPAVRAAATAHYEAIFDALGTLLEERRDEVSHPIRGSGRRCSSR